METTNEIIIVDLEATCRELDGDYQKQQSEIIEKLFNVGMVALGLAAVLLTQWRKPFVTRPGSCSVLRILANC